MDMNTCDCCNKEYPVEHMLWDCDTPNNDNEGLLFTIMLERQYCAICFSCAHQLFKNNLHRLNQQERTL